MKSSVQFVVAQCSLYTYIQHIRREKKRNKGTISSVVPYRFKVISQHIHVYIDIDATVVGGAYICHREGIKEGHCSYD